MPRAAASPAPRRHRSPALQLGAVAVAVAALWTAGWFGAAHLAGGALDAWMAREGAAGRQWTCPSRTIAGFPAALRLRCQRPTFRGEVAGHISTGVVEELVAGVDLLAPTTLKATLKGPLNLRAEDDAFVAEFSWNALGVSVPGLARGPQGGALEATRLAATLATPEGGVFNMRAAHLTGEAAPVAGAPGDKGFAFAGNGVTFPTLDAPPELDGPADVAGQGVLTEADLLSAPTVRRLEAWRQAGGQLTVGSFALTAGTFSGSATGTLGLDDAHRPAGRLDTTLAGFEPIAKRFGIPVEGIQIGGLLSTFLAGGKQQPKAQHGVQLPLVLADGRLSVGPFPTGLKLDPLY